MVYSFDEKVAKEYGVDAAVMIMNFQFWIKKNKANKKNFFNGRYWTYNSIPAFCELFPFWSARQIGYILKKLVDDGVLMAENFNKSKFDKTNWYAFVDEQKWIMDDTKLSHPSLKNVAPIPDILPDNKTDSVIVERFIEFANQQGWETEEF